MSDFRAEFEACARRYHARLQQDGHQEHRWWRFEHCPAGPCAQARAALAARPPALAAPRPGAPESVPTSANVDSAPRAGACPRRSA